MQGLDIKSIKIDVAVVDPQTGIKEGGKKT
jgi:hypothetical protein